MTNKKTLPIINTLSIIFFIFFIGLISLPFFFSIIQEDIKVNSENRNLFQWDSVFRESLVEIPEKFDHYWADHHGLREQLINIFYATRYRLGMPPGSINLGKDDWFFEYNPENPYDIKVMENWEKYISLRKKITEKKRVDYIFFFAPQKKEIYPEFLNESTISQKKTSLLKNVQAKIDVDYLFDAREALLKERNNYQLYHRLDIHWNIYATRLIQSKLMKKINVTYPKYQFEVINYSDSEFILVDSFERGLTNIGGLQNSMTEDQVWFKDEYSFCDQLKAYSLDSDHLINMQSKRFERIKFLNHRTLCGRGHYKALVLGDSFFISLWPFFSEYFEEVVYIKYRYQQTNRPEELEGLIEKYQPDIVIEEIASRYLQKNYNEYKKP